MSFKNPQRTINKEFDAWINGGNSLTNKIATTAEGIRKSVAAQKKLNKEMQDKEDIQMQSMYSKANEFVKSGNRYMDQNILSFWNSKVDEYFQIKNGMQDGNIGRQEGNQALSKIMGLVPQFKNQAQYLGDESMRYDTEVKADNVSSTGSTQNKLMLQRIHDGSNVQIVEREGQLFYFSPEEKDEDGNVLKEATMLNGSELEAMNANGKSLFELKPNITAPLTAIYNKAIQPDKIDGKFVEYIKNVKKGDINPMTGFEYAGLEEGMLYTFKTITEKNKPLAIDEIANSNGISSMMSNQSVMRRVWQDEIPDEEIERIASEKGYDPSQYKDPWHEFASDVSSDEITRMNAEQNDIMKTYLAEKSFNENANMDQTLKFVKEEPYNPNKEDEDGKPFLMSTVENVYDFFENPVDNRNLLINQSIEGDNGKQTINDVRIDKETGEIVLWHKEYSLDSGTNGQVTDKENVIGRYDPKDPKSQALLAEKLQRAVGGSNKDNNKAVSTVGELYPAYAEKQRLEKIKAKETAQGNGGFNDFPDGSSYEKWKVKNGLDKLSSTELKFLSQDKMLTNMLSPAAQERKEFKKSFLNQAEYKVMMAILEQRNATKLLQ